MLRNDDLSHGPGGDGDKTRADTLGATRELQAGRHTGGRAGRVPHPPLVGRNEHGMASRRSRDRVHQRAHRAGADAVIGRAPTSAAGHNERLWSP